MPGSSPGGGSTKRRAMRANSEFSVSPPSAGILAAQDAQAQFGVYAEVVKPGRVAAGDPVVLA